jgi:hypothetical protein
MATTSSVKVDIVLSFDQMIKAFRDAADALDALARQLHPPADDATLGEDN